MNNRKTIKYAPLKLALSLTRVAVPLTLASSISPSFAQITVATPNGQPSQLSQSEQEAMNAQALLTGALKRIAANGNDGSALIDAGNAAITLEDANAAMGFFNRANAVWPNNPRVLAGMGSALVRLENPTEALRLFQLAASKGGSERTFLADRALAYDLMGDNARAQKDYQSALQGGYSDRTLRLYALSLGITGETDKAVQTIAPLLQKRDRAAWRDRAFILAMNGRTKEALDIVKQTMPANVASGITPYLMKMDRLSNKQLAAAVHYGQFPSSDTQLAAVGRGASNTQAVAPTASKTMTDQKGTSPRFVDEKGRPVKLSKAEQRRLIQEQEEKKKVDAAEQEKQRLAAVQRQQEEARIAEQNRLAEETRLAEQKRLAEFRRQDEIRIENERKVAEAARLAEAKRAEEAREAERIRLASVQPITPPVPAPVSAPLQSPLPSPSPTISAPVATPPTPGFSASNASTTAPSGSLIGPVNNAVPSSITTASLPPSTVATGSVEAPTTSSNIVAAATPVSPAAAPAGTEGSFHAFSLSDLVQAVKPPEEGPARNEGYVDLATLEKLRADKIAADRAAAAKAKAEADKKKAAEAKAVKDKELAETKAKEAAEKKKAAAPKVWAQIATGTGANKFTSDLRKAKSRDAALFKGKDGSRIETGKMSRLVIGPFASVKEANAWLAKYKKAGGDGFVWTSKGDEDVKPVAK